MRKIKVAHRGKKTELMAKYRVLFSAKVYTEEEIEAASREDAEKKAREQFIDENGYYEVDECCAELLPSEKYYFQIESIEGLED